MLSTQATSGSARAQGELWGERARDYADFQEPQLWPLFEDAIRRTGIGPGSTALDVGCGPGGFCRLAVEAGASVVGIDASEALVEIARERAPSACFAIGDMQFLPYEDDSFEPAEEGVSADSQHRNDGGATVSRRSNPVRPCGRFVGAAGYRSDAQHAQAIRAAREGSASPGAHWLVLRQARALK